MAVHACVVDGNARAVACNAPSVACNAGSVACHARTVESNVPGVACNTGSVAYHAPAVNSSAGFVDHHARRVACHNCAANARWRRVAARDYNAVMERKPYSTGSIVGAVVLLVVVLLGFYVGGYFALCQYKNEGGIYRTYRYNWLASCYRPLAGIESEITGIEVELLGPTRAFFSHGEVYEGSQHLPPPGSLP